MKLNSRSPAPAENWLSAPTAIPALSSRNPHIFTLSEFVENIRTEAARIVVYAAPSENRAQRIGDKIGAKAPGFGVAVCQQPAAGESWLKISEAFEFFEGLRIRRDGGSGVLETQR